ncbi:MAG: histidinol-phosphatase HisJ family protein [Anaerovoracaceae bacterium]
MHTHTGFSDDCDHTFDEMVAAAAETNLEGIAITDHYDPGYPDPEFPFTIDFPAYQAAMEKKQRELEGRLEIIKGVEIGIMDSELQAAHDLAASYDYDFIIGSFHCLRNQALDLIDYSQLDRSAVTRDFYSYMYDMLKKFKDYDVIGHYTIIDRYIGGIFDLDPSMDIIRETLKMIIEDGKGIEINTSSYKYNMPVGLPRIQILEAYRELGGEILTIGSDSHEPERYGSHFDKALAIARGVGFKYYCSYKNREPVFHRFY